MKIETGVVYLLLILSAVAFGFAGYRMSSLRDENALLKQQLEQTRGVPILMNDLPVGHYEKVDNVNGNHHATVQMYDEDGKRVRTVAIWGSEKQVPSRFAVRETEQREKYISEE